MDISKIGLSIRMLDLTDVDQIKNLLREKRQTVSFEQIESCLDEEDYALYEQIPSTHTFGAFVKGELVAMAVVSYVRVFPCEDTPNGVFIHLSGCYTKPNYRHKGYMSAIIQEIGEFAKEVNADYLSCDNLQSNDAKARDFFLVNGFEDISDGESRMWKQLQYKEN